MTESSRQYGQHRNNQTQQPVKWLIATVKELNVTMTVQFPVLPTTPAKKPAEQQETPTP